MQNTFHVCHRGNVTPWEPRDGVTGELPPDCTYFGRVLTAVDEALPEAGLTVYLTWRVDELPSYGPDVVAVVLGDEDARMPVYTDAVLTVFKCYGTRPWLAPPRRGVPDVVDARLLAGFARLWARRVRDRLRDRGHDRPAVWPARSHDLVDLIPLGYYRQQDLPTDPIGDRGTDAAFLGSVTDVVEGRMQRWSPRRLLWSAKRLARVRMVEALQRFADANPDRSIHLKVTPGFFSAENEDGESYSRRLRDTKVCLAPRGTAVETFRVFEGMRYGCVVVSERLPPHWFYAGSPVVELDDWRRLPDTLSELLADPEALHARHLATVAWWDEVCSEPAVAGRMVTRIRERSTTLAGATGGRG